MARKTVGYVKLQWACPNCGTKNPGPNKFCMGCGAAQPPDVHFEAPERQELITDEEELKKAQAGPDIHCPFCGTRNPGDARFCGQCGGDLAEGKKRQEGQVLGAFQSGSAQQVACPSCGSLNPDTAYRCSNCGAPLEKKAAAPPVQKPAKPAPKFGLGCIIAAALGILGLILLVALLSAGGRTEGVEATLQSTNWERMVYIQALQPVTREGFIDQIPAEASIGGCEERYHHTESEPVENSFEVCGTPYTVDQGSGFGEVVQDCVYEVYAQYCAYTVQEWQVVDQVALQGSDRNPRWPSPALAEGQTLGETREQYTAVFSTSQGPVTYTFTDENLYQQLVPGSSWVLEITSSGRIVSIEPQ